MGKVFAVGVGPGSQNYITEIVRKVIVDADVVVGYKYTLDIISSLIQGKKVPVCNSTQSTPNLYASSTLDNKGSINRLVLILFFFNL